MNRNEPGFDEDVHAIACERLPAELAERGSLSGAAAFSFDSFLWASKEKMPLPQGDGMLG